MKWPQRLLPDTPARLARGQAGLVIITSLGLSIAIMALLLIWAISGELERRTPPAAAALVALLAGLSALARSGRPATALWMLVALLTLIISVGVAYYGVGSVSAAGYVVPIVLAACGLGMWAGLGAASMGALVVWMLAWGETAGWYTPALAPASYHLTLDAPVLTILFAAEALVAGGWSRYLIQNESRRRM